MSALDPLDLDLLYFLCSASHHRCRVVRIKRARLVSLRRLRDAGFVGNDNFDPSAAAIADWLARRDETPVPRDSEAPAEPPAPKAAADGGGADARCADAPPPRRSAKNTPGASDKARKALSAEESTSAKRIEDRAPPIQPPPSPYSPEKQDFLRDNAARLRAGRARAEAFLDSGKTSQDAGSVTLRIEARKVEAQRAEAARLADPIEQAKTLIRRMTRHAVFGAEVSMGEKGKGKFFVGNKLVDEAELFAIAARWAA